MAAACESGLAAVAAAPSPMACRLGEDVGTSAAVADRAAAVAAAGNGDAEGGRLISGESDRDCGGDLKTAKPKAGKAAPPALQPSSQHRSGMPCLP